MEEPKKMIRYTRLTDEIKSQLYLPLKLTSICQTIPENLETIVKKLASENLETTQEEGYNSKMATRRRNYRISRKIIHRRKY